MLVYLSDRYITVSVPGTFTGCKMSDCSDSEATTDKQLKIVIVGDGASGKVSLGFLSLTLTFMNIFTNKKQALAS